MDLREESLRMIFFGNGGSGIFFIIMIILVLTFAVTLLPYILIFGFIWFVVKSLLRPFTSRGSSSYQGRPEGEGEAYRKTYEARPTETPGDPVIDNQVKSVQDEDFFRQNHEVVDVNYDEDDDHTTT